MSILRNTYSTLGCGFQSVIMRSFVVSKMFYYDKTFRNKFWMILVLIIFYSFPTLAKPKITTSTIPLASIIAMLTHDQADFRTIINETGGCPHHYHASPSDLKKVQDADLVIYIDEQFDGFAAKLMRNNSENIIKLSDFKGLKFINDNGQINWHFWLDLDKVKIVLEELAVIIIYRFPELKEQIHSNLQIALRRISDIAKIKSTELSSVQDVILLDDSVEYFFLDKKVSKLYQIHYKSLNYIDKLQNIISNSISKCLIINSDQKLEFYKQLPAHMVQVNSERWGDTEIPIQDLFYKKYNDIIEQVKKCKN